MNSEVKRILEAVSGCIGRNIFIYDESFLLKSLARRLTKNAIENMSAYLDFVTDNSAEGAEFFRSLRQARVWIEKPCNTFTSHSLPPREWAKARVWDWRWYIR